MSKAKPLTKYESLHYLLGQYGNGTMDTATFWKEMNGRGYTSDDIDQWCEQYHQLEAKREQDDEERRRKKAEDRTARATASRYAGSPRREEQGDHRQERARDHNGAVAQGEEGQGQAEARQEGEDRGADQEAWQEPVNEIFETSGGLRFIVDLYRHAIVTLTEQEKETYRKIGYDRHHAKGDNFADATRLYADHPEKEDEIGAIGEGAFSKLTGLAMNADITVVGDSGIDFTFIHSRDDRPVTVAISIAQKPNNLFMRAETTNGRTHAEIWVLSGISADWLSVIFLGYRTREFMLTRPVVPARHGAMAAEGRKNHECHHSKLLPMPQLLRAIK